MEEYFIKLESVLKTQKFADSVKNNIDEMSMEIDSSFYFTMGQFIAQNELYDLDGNDYFELLDEENQEKLLDSIISEFPELEF